MWSCMYGCISCDDGDHRTRFQNDWLVFVTFVDFVEL